MTEVLLTLDGVSFELPDGRALLTSIDLEVSEGETIAIMGPSGSGKSTLLALCGGLATPTSGSVRRATDLTAIDTGWVLQTTIVLGHRTVRENVALSAFARTGSWRRAIVESQHALDITGLSGIAHTAAAVVSGGERQRIGVARVVVSVCRLVFADEPTANLDAALVHLISDVLVGASVGATIIATHDPRVAAACDSRLDLIDGRLVRA